MRSIMNSSYNILIAGGKTGGHLFPGIAVAQGLEKIKKEVTILFVGTRAPFEIKTLNTYGYSHKSIISKPVKGGNPLSKAFSVGIILFSVLQSIFILKSFKPDFVLGVGGFSSFAVVLAAWVLRIPTAIQEQNAIPGMTNRMLSRFAGTIFTSFEDTQGLNNNPKVKFVGNPIRRSYETAPQKEPPGKALPVQNLDPNKFTILVTGGSQGAKRINDTFVGALNLMAAPDQFNIIHQTGIDSEKEIQKKYSRMNIKATVNAFYDNMPKLQDVADLVITRAGAGTISEICAKGLPAIFIPFPHAADDHQTRNAKKLSDAQASILIHEKDLNEQNLKSKIEELSNDPKRLTEMAATLKKFSKPNADITIAKYILNKIGVEA